MRLSKKMRELILCLTQQGLNEDPFGITLWEYTKLKDIEDSTKPKIMKVFAWIWYDLKTKKGNFCIIHIILDDVINDEIWMCLQEQFPLRPGIWI